MACCVDSETIGRTSRVAHVIQDEIVSLRREIHRHPELRFEEKHTATLVAERLSALGCSVQTGIGKTGVVGLLENGDGPCVAVRVDMDALPIEEKTGLPFASEYVGLMHACGHDAHTAMGVGVARLLSELRDSWNGTLKLIFQPAEEIPLGQESGARAMIADGVLEAPSPHAIFGIHCWPEVPVGTVVCAPGPAMAGGILFRIRVHGESAHAATPHRGRDAILAAAQLVSSLHTITSRRIAPQTSATIHIGTIHGGSRQSIVAQDVTMTGTIRYVENETADYLEKIVRTMVETVPQAFGCSADAAFERSYPPLHNDPELADLVLPALREAFGAQNVVDDMPCTMTGEDFAFYAERVPSLYLKLGVTDGPETAYPLHHDHFNPSEKALPTGVAALALCALSAFSGWPRKAS